MSCFLSFLTDTERPECYSCTRCCSQFCKSGKTQRKMRSQSTVLEEFCFTSKFLGLTSALFPWHESDVKEIKFLESAPCSSLNKTQKNLGTCFDVQNGWWHLPWQSRCIFDNLVISVSTCWGMWASRCSLSIWKKSLEFDTVGEESWVSNLVSEEGTFIGCFICHLRPRIREHATVPYVFQL